VQIIQHIEIRDERAYIRGTNKKAEMIARMYVGTDYTVEDVMQHYNLSASEVHASIVYYYDNQEELDARHQQSIEWAEQNATTLEQYKAKLVKRRQNNSDDN